MDLSASGMFVQKLELAPMAIAAWTAALLVLTLAAPVAVSADFERGKAAFERRAFSVALSEFLPLAELGHSGAQFYLGRMYGVGLGLPRDYALAAQWFRKAAHQGHAMAQNNLGVMYRNGRGVPQDGTLAAQWYRKAADQGLDLAQYNLVWFPINKVKL